MRNLFRSAAAVTATCGLGLTGLMSPSHAAIGAPLPAAAAGTLVAWGQGSGVDTFGGASLGGVDVVDVAASNNGWGAAVKPDGSVVAWGVHPDTSGLSNVASVAVSNAGLVALTKGHTLAVADAGAGASLAPAPALTGVTAVAVDGAAAAAIAGGRVHEWGAATGAPFMAIPADLTDGTARATSIAGGNFTFTAVKADHTAESWGLTPPAVPQDVQGKVDSIAGGMIADRATYAAVLTNGSVRAWDANGPIATPAALAGKKIADLSVNGSIVALTSDGTVVSWGADSTDPANALTDFPAPSSGVPTAVAAGQNDANGVSFAYAIVSPFAALTAPSVAGTAVVGQTLTATPATFDAKPDTTTGQWLANGTAIPGATGSTLALTSAYAGKHISYRSAAKRGAATASSESTPTAAVSLSAGQQKLAKDQAKLKHDQAKLKHLKKALKKAHGHKKAKLKKKIVKLKKTIRTDKKHIAADK